MLSKLTGILILPCLAAALALFLVSKQFKNSGVRRNRHFAYFALLLITAVFVLNAGYKFDGTFSPIASFHWDSDLFKSLANSVFGRMPSPLPFYYLEAFDMQFFNKNRGLFTYFLNGNISDEGWRSYYWWAFVLKTPVSLLAGCVLSALFFIREKRAQCEQKLYWLAPAMFMIIFTYIVRIDMGFRYLLPMVPFLIAVAAHAFERLWESGAGGKAAVVFLCIYYAASSITAFGNELSYFNEFAGGPRGGARHMVESNLDWGQNLVRLKRYAEENDLQPLLVYNYGLVPPQAYGIRAGWVPCQPQKAVVAISVNYLNGIDPFQKRPRECFEWLRNMEPIEKIGGGLYIYDARGVYER